MLLPQSAGVIAHLANQNLVNGVYFYPLAFWEHDKTVANDSQQRTVLQKTTPWLKVTKTQAKLESRWVSSIKNIVY